MSDWWTGIAPTEITIRCGGDRHRLRWEHGRLLAPDHGDVDDERTLTALGGQPHRCIELVDAWARHRHDLRALVVGPRGGPDVVMVDLDDPRPPGPASVRRGPATVTVVATAVATGRGRSSASAASSGDDDADADAALRSVVGLGGGLGERLVATVAAHWLERVRAGDPAAAQAWERLYAALYGRVLVALSGWLGEPLSSLALELELIGEHEPRSLTRVDGRVRAQLPFAWLVEVWAQGMTVLRGQFCLAASSGDGAEWELTTVAPDLATVQRLSLRVSG